MASTEPLLTKKQVADLLSVSVRTVNRLMANGFLRYIRIRGSVRFVLEEVDQVFRQNVEGCGCSCDCACARFREIVDG